MPITALYALSVLVSVAIILCMYLLYMNNRSVGNKIYIEDNSIFTDLDLKLIHRITVKDLKDLSYDAQKIEIASAIRYYYGDIKDIPKELYDLKVAYIAAGKADSFCGSDNTLLVDAE